MTLAKRSGIGTDPSGDASAYLSLLTGVRQPAGIFYSGQEGRTVNLEPTR